MSTKFMYLRATRQQQPSGCLAYSINTDLNTVSYQVSVVNPTEYLKEGGEKRLVAGHEYVTKDRMVRDSFDRTAARGLAEVALTERPITCNVVGVDEAAPDCWEITVAIMSHLNLSGKNPDAQECMVPGRAQRVAGEWLRAHGYKKENKTWVLAQK